MKGVGEGGTICTPAAVLSAVADALREYDIKIESSPIGPSDVVALVTAAEREENGQ
jgi:CO/xanthine dehydrogenase Mo-binding subunit